MIFQHMRSARLLEVALACGRVLLGWSRSTDDYLLTEPSPPRLSDPMGG